MTTLETHEAIKQFYLALPGKTEEGWQKAARDPAKQPGLRRMVGLPSSEIPTDQLV